MHALHWLSRRCSTHHSPRRHDDVPGLRYGPVPFHNPSLGESLELWPALSLRIHWFGGFALRSTRLAELLKAFLQGYILIFDSWAPRPEFDLPSVSNSNNKACL